MNVIRTTDVNQALHDFTEVLLAQFAAGKKLLWFVSGGSNTALAVRIMQHIPATMSRQLTIAPIDERYGPIGHADSNFQQLLDAGFDAKEARLIPVLQSGLTFEQTTAQYDQVVRETLASIDYSIAQLGIGPDGHIAGILPHSPAINATADYVTAYSSPPYERITTTFPLLRKLDAIYTFAYGANKQNALQVLVKTNVPLSEQPAQFLKTVPEAYVYNDQIGDTE